MLLWFGDRPAYEFVIIEFVNMEMLISFVVSFLVYTKYRWSASLTVPSIMAVFTLCRTWEIWKDLLLTKQIFWNVYYKLFWRFDHAQRKEVL